MGWRCVMRGTKRGRPITAAKQLRVYYSDYVCVALCASVCLWLTWYSWNAVLSLTHSLFRCRYDKLLTEWWAAVSVSMNPLQSDVPISPHSRSENRLSDCELRRASPLTLYPHCVWLQGHRARQPATHTHTHTHTHKHINWSCRQGGD